MLSAVKKLSSALAVAAITASVAAVALAGSAGPAARRDAKSGVEFVLVPGGEFMMGSAAGSRSEQPVHKKSVADFWLGRTEVTVAQFRRFVEATGYRTDAEQSGGSFAIRSPGEWVLIEGRTWRTPGFEQTDDHPVVCVSWNDTTAFALWAGFRLPSEAEWEYAAGNGPRHTSYSWGAGGRLPATSGILQLARSTQTLQFSQGTTMALSIPRRCAASRQTTMVCAT